MAEANIKLQTVDKPQTKPACLKWSASDFAALCDSNGVIHVSVVAHGSEVTYPEVAFTIPPNVAYQLHCRPGETLPVMDARKAWHGYCEQFKPTKHDKKIRDYPGDYNAKGERMVEADGPKDFDIALEYANWKTDGFEAGVFFHKQMNTEQALNPDYVVGDLSFKDLDFDGKGYVYMSALLGYLRNNIPGLKEYLDEEGDEKLVVHGVHCRSHDQRGDYFQIEAQDVGRIGGKYKSLGELIAAHPLVKEMSIDINIGGNPSDKTLDSLENHLRGAMQAVATLRREKNTNTKVVTRKESRGKMCWT